MPTSYTSVLKLALPVTGELSGTWGDVVNDNITQMVEQAITGKATINTWVGASHTLTVANGTSSESRCAILEASGTPGADAQIICPTATKLYILKNSITGGFSATLKTASGSGVSVPNGKTMWLYCDGTNVVTGTDYLSTLTLGTPLTVSNGGTGVATIPANYVPYGNGTSPYQSSANFQFDGTVMRVGTNGLLGGLTNPVIGQTGAANNYVQGYVYNATNGASSSADFVAYANNSTDAHGWADLGFTSASYADAAYTVTGPNEAYVFGSALNSSFTGNLVYATDSTGSANAHQWYVGGFTQAKSAWKMQLTSTGLQLASALAPAYGGTGLTSPGTSGNVLTSDGTNWISSPPGSLLGTNNTWTGTQTFNGTASVPSMVLKEATEVATVLSTSASGTINYDVNTTSVLYYTTNASANWTLNVRSSSGVALNTLMSTGQSLTLTFLVTQGSTAYYATGFQIDGTSVTPKWQGGAAPTAGNASSVDVYTYTIIKTGSATYTVFASLTKFA